MAEKTPKKDEGSTAVADKTFLLPCLGACRGEEREHAREGKLATCGVCAFERHVDVGAGSPKGRRWFVTKFMAWTTTMTPEDWIVHEGGRTVKQKPVRLVFKKIVKPRKLVSTQGVLGTENPEGGDMNASRWLGVYEIFDPGANEEGKAETKNDALSRQILAFLRAHEYYRKTAQDNRLAPNPELIELTWDPTLKKTAPGVAVSRRVSLDQHDEEAPLDAVPAPKKASVGLTRRIVPKDNAGALDEGE